MAHLAHHICGLVGEAPLPAYIPVVVDPCSAGSEVITSYTQGKAGSSKVFAFARKPPTPAEAEVMMRQLEALGGDAKK